MRQQKRFPLVADDETILAVPPVMDLYEESDLISNIRGSYHDRFAGGEPPMAHSLAEKPVVEREEELLPPLFESKPSAYSRKERHHKVTVPYTVSEQKTQGQLAREAAREDLKKKRAASYLRDEKPAPARVVKRPHPVSQQTQTTPLSHLADKLVQTDYILADMPPVYSLKKEDREQEQATKKNSYDFLRKSQVYNYPERQVRKEHQVAQELNLTRIEEEME